jgi:hypothetical protein
VQVQLPSWGKQVLHATSNAAKPPAQISRCPLASHTVAPFDMPAHACAGRAEGGTHAPPEPPAPLTQRVDAASFKPELDAAKARLLASLLTVPHGTRSLAYPYVHKTRSSPSQKVLTIPPPWTSGGHMGSGDVDSAQRPAEAVATHRAPSVTPPEVEPQAGPPPSQLAVPHSS